MRRYVFIIAIAVLLVVIAIAVVVARPSTTKKNTNAANTNTKTAVAPGTLTNIPAPVVAAPKSTDEIAVTYAARTVCEMTGSTSTGDHGAGFTRAKPWATTSFQKVLDTSATQQDRAAGTYQATIARALSVDVQSITASLAAVQVSVTQQITSGESTSTARAVCQVDLLKQGSDWKVNNTSWKPQ